MMKPQTAMLVQMMKAIQDEQGVSIDEAYDTVLLYVAVQLQVEIHLTTGGIKKAAFDKLVDLFDLELLKAEPWDWFGEAGEHLGVFHALDKSGKQLESIKKAMENISTLGTMPAALFIKDIRTGRDLYRLHKITGDNAILFGVEADLRCYRTALLNSRIHDIPCQLLGLTDKVDFNIKSENWRQANLWTPLKPTKLV